MEPVSAPAPACFTIPEVPMVIMEIIKILLLPFVQQRPVSKFSWLSRYLILIMAMSLTSTMGQIQQLHYYIPAAHVMMLD